MVRYGPFYSGTACWKVFSRLLCPLMTVNLEGIIPHMVILQLLPVLGNTRERSVDGVDSFDIMHVEKNVNAVLGCVGLC